MAGRVDFAVQTHATSQYGGEIRFSGTMTRSALFKAGTRFDGCGDGVTLVINYQSGNDFGVIRLQRAASSDDSGGAQVLMHALQDLAG